MMRVLDLLRFDNDHHFTGWHMLAVTCLFFGTIIGVNLVLVFAATGTFPGLVVKNSYVASQHYNELLAADRAQSEAGWRMELEAPGGVLNFRLADREGVVERRLTATAIAGRPSSTRDDRTIDLIESPAGYRAAEALPAGQWDIDVEARRSGEVVFRARKRFFVKPGA